MFGEPSQKEKVFAFLLGMSVALVLLAIVLYQVPAVQDRVGWRVDFAMAYVRGFIDPVKPMPTPESSVQTVSNDNNVDVPLPEDHPTETMAPSPSPSPSPMVEATQAPTSTPAPTFTPTALPAKVELPAPAYEKQAVNNCGPATLTMHLRYYGWVGDQSVISKDIKPINGDRNVNVEELVSWISTNVPGIEVQYRVGGDLDTLKRFLAAGFPVTIEEAYVMDQNYWLNDDRWAGHYLLLTGYDDATQEFITQDVFVNPNVRVPYEKIDKNWKSFNRVYILLYPPDQRARVQELLGDQWDVATNRQHALDAAQKETETDSTDSFAWFNLGTNLVYFEKYSEAAQAYDQARKIGLPQRMLRYQFGPFFAYFHTNRMDDLLALTEYALKRTPNSEEALLWRGWAMYRQNNREEAVKLFQEALTAHPGYADAEYALNFVNSN
jgi:uncharacterized protein YvpB